MESAPAPPQGPVPAGATATSEESHERLRLLTVAAAALLSGDNPDQVVELLFEAIAGPLHLDACFNFMIDEAGRCLRLESYGGVSEEVAESLARVDYGQAICGTVALQRQPFYVPDVQASQDPLTGLLRSIGLRAYYCHPLIAGDRLIGTLSFGTRQRDAFSEEDLGFFRTLSFYVAVVKERRIADMALRDSNEKTQHALDQLEAIYDTAPVGLCVIDTSLRYVRINKALAEMNGFPVEAHIGRHISEIVPDVTGAAQATLNRVLETGEPLIDIELTGHTAAAPDTIRTWKESFFPLHDRNGTIIGINVVAEEITARKRAEELATLLADEVDHRARNLMTVAQVILRQTRAETVPDFVRIATGRINALARVHTLLAASRWQGADLHQLVEEELAPYSSRDAARATVAGPPVALGPSAAQSLALTLHELATNAAKYGALSTPHGHVDVEWSWREAGAILLVWRESGGMPVHPPMRRGTGMNVIERVIRHQLGGAVRLYWRPTGLVCEMDVPLGNAPAGKPAFWRQA